MLAAAVTWKAVAEVQLLATPFAQEINGVAPFGAVLQQTVKGFVHKGLERFWVIVVDGPHSIGLWGWLAGRSTPKAATTPHQNKNRKANAPGGTAQTPCC